MRIPIAGDPAFGGQTLSGLLRGRRPTRQRAGDPLRGGGASDGLPRRQRPRARTGRRRCAAARRTTPSHASTARALSSARSSREPGTATPLSCFVRRSSWIVAFRASAEVAAWLARPRGAPHVPAPAAPRGARAPRRCRSARSQPSRRCDAGAQALLAPVEARRASPGDRRSGRSARDRAERARAGSPRPAASRDGTRSVSDAAPSSPVA